MTPYGHTGYKDSSLSQPDYQPTVEFEIKLDNYNLINWSLSLCGNIDVIDFSLRSFYCTNSLKGEVRTKRKQLI